MVILYWYNNWIGQVRIFSRLIFEWQGYFDKVEKILKGSLVSIPSPSPLVKIQTMGGKVYLRCKGKTLPGVVNKLLKTKSLLTSPTNVLPYYLKHTFPPIIWIFTEGEGDGIESRLPFKIFSTLPVSNCILVPNIVHLFPQIMYFSLLAVYQMKSTNFLQLLSLLPLPFWNTFFFLKPHSIFVRYWSIVFTRKIQNFLWSDKWSVDKIRVFLNSKSKNCNPHFIKPIINQFYILMVFCYRNCSDLLWEKIVWVIEKNFWNLRLKAENLQKFWDHSNNLFKQLKVRTISGNRMLF